MVHLIEEHADSAPAGNLVPPDQRRSRAPHFAFAVDDIDAFVKVLHDLRVPMTSGPVQRPDGALQLFIHDPDDHLVELCSREDTRMK